MEAYCTSIIPVKVPNAKLTREIISICKNQRLLSDYCNYGGAINLKAIPDININPFDFYFIPSPKTDIQCAFSESTLTLILTWKNTYKDYYSLVNQSLEERKKLVNRVLEYNPKDEKLIPFMKLLEGYRDKGLSINYAFTFYSICDENFTEASEQHLKVLAEPSVINMDDMLSSLGTSAQYDSKTKINKEILETIKDFDLYSEQKTFITWASVVSLSKSKEIFVKNHITLTLMELHIQRIWNLCYSQNNSLNNCITNIKKCSKDINKIIIDTYRILIESKNCISATYSSRLSGIYSAIVESSQLPKNIEDLEQKLNYLIVFTNSINQNKNRRLQQGSEILLFLIAIAQIVPLFFNLPIVTHNMISIGTVVGICVLGVSLIRSRYHN
jgi:hypothetical protein